ncbi:MAG: autotransporter outer membrane beta-barrel domain-containing protein, partial [Synergistaceae bacterium]|nr:autotransporter outer membrane beta-barrel domain-containing protein [Synergistaceae bacterium]
IMSDDIYGRSSAAFGGIDGAWMRVHNDNSHVDFDGTNIIAGYASKKREKGKDDNPDSSTLWAAFIDIGRANYDTYDNFDFVANRAIDDIHGDGTLRSYGIGLMARREWENGFRIEGSLRGGKLKNEFTARDYLDGDGVPAAYETDAPYYGLHLGVGQTKQLKDPRDRLDLLLRYYWNRQDGERATLPDGSWIEFDNDDSHKFRIGARFTRERDYRRSWYVGLAAEHEFAGSIHASTSRFALPAYDLSGTTGIGEIGFIIRPDTTDDDKDNNFSLEAGLQGYVGKYSGFSGGIRFEWEF